MAKEVNTLNCIMSTGAAVVSKSISVLEPCNWGMVTGQPGALVRINCSATAQINESGSTSYEYNLNENGRLSFSVSMQDEKPGVIDINMFQANSPDKVWNGTTVFDDYRIGSGSFKVYNYTTGAAADGVTPNSVYLITQPVSPLDSAITKVRVTIEGNAEIQGYPGVKTADIKLNSDYSAEIDLVATSAGNVTVTLSLPESSGSFESFNVYFQAIPTNRNQTPVTQL